MIVMFDKNETKFGSNGLAVIDNDIRGEPVVNELFNGLYSLEFKYSKSGEHLELIDNDMIVKAPTPDGDQPFRIYKVIKQMGYYDVSAYHIFYDLAGNFIEDSNIVDSNGMNAIKHIGTGLQYPTSFEFTSDIAANNSARIVRMNAVQALLDTETDNSFINRWGGEIKRDGDTISMNKARGTDRGFKVKYRKNLTGFEATLDRTNVVTRIMPYGYNGLMLPEKYVDSPHINDYPIIYIKKFDYNDIKAIDPDADSNDENAVPLEQAYELLRQAAQREYDDNKVDIQTSNFKITMKELSDTRQYSSFKAIEKLSPWDYVSIDTDVFSIKSRMISYKYNPKTKHYIEVELGNYIPSFSDVTSKTDSQINEIQNNIDQLNNDVLGIATAPNGNHTIWADRAPTADDKGKDGDVWYYQNGDLVEMWVYDGTAIPPQWRQKITDLTGQEIEDKVDQAQEDATKALNDANTAVENSNKAVEDAGFANSTANDAKASAEEATSKAADAISKADNAQSDATTAINNAQDALDKYDNLEASVETEITNINGELSQKVSQTEYNNLKGTVESNSTQITQNQHDIQLKANQTQVDTINKTVQNQQTEINQNSSQIELKADQTVVDNINKTVSSNTAAINVNTNNIKLKANQSTVDTLAGRVSTAEGKIEVQAGQIAQTVSKTELNSTLSGYATQTWTQGQIKTTADNINLSVQKVQSNIDNLEIGGRNLVLNSFDLSKFKTWQQESGVKPVLNADNSEMTITSVHGGLIINMDNLSSNLPLKDVTVTLSVDVKGGENVELNYYSNGNWYRVKRLPTTSDWIRYSTQFVWQEGGDLTSSDQFVIYTSASSALPMTIRKPKVEISNKASDWSPAPEDAASVTDFANLEIKVNGIQGTVANKADQSQVTQLADQITSVVSDIGQTNLVYNSDFAVNIEGWLSNTEISIGNNQYDHYNGSNSLGIHAKNLAVGSWKYVYSKKIDVKPGYKYSASATLFVTEAAKPEATKVQLEIDFFDSSNNRVGNPSANFDLSKYATKQQLKINGVSVPETAVTACLAVQLNGNINLILNHPMLVAADTVGPYSPDNVSQSQITQMKDDINLRVQKGDVINQINISPESILIAGQKVHITGQTTIDNAVIKDAMIADLSASKLTAGIIDASKINVVKLNASNITTGTITGSNLSINLNTGEILFTKGSIKSTNGLLNINVNNGSFSQTNASGDGIYFMSGELNLIDKNFTWPDLNSDHTYGTIDNFGVNMFDQQSVRSMRILGTKGVHLETGKTGGSLFLGMLGSSGTGADFDTNHSAIYSSGRSYIAAGNSRGKLPAQAMVQVGVPLTYPGSKLDWTINPNSDGYDSGKDIILESDTILLQADKDYVSSFAVSSDTKSGYLMSTTAYNRSYSSGQTATITQNGVFGVIVSAAKYKLAISDVNDLSDQAHSFLSVKPKQWFDKTETEEVADELTEGYNGTVDSPQLLPHYGYIAEDIYSAGLDNVTFRDPDTGELQGIQYDRLIIYLHQLVKELYQRVNDLEAKIYSMEANK